MDEVKINRAENSERDYRVELTTGVITGKEFLKEIFKRDQSDGVRSLAGDNVELLRHPDVADFFQRRENDELLWEYHNLLSLSYFHIGQQQAMAGFDRQALEEFESSLQVAEQVEVTEDYEYGEWVEYVRGTVAYMRNDLETLQKCFDEVQDKRNKEILEAFVKGLESRGEPDYAADSEASSK